MNWMAGLMVFRVQVLFWFLNEDQNNQDSNNGWNGSNPEKLLIIIVASVHEMPGNKGASEGSGNSQPHAQAVASPPAFGRGNVPNQGIARGGLNAISNARNDAIEEHATESGP